MQMLGIMHRISESTYRNQQLKILSPALNKTNQKLSKSKHCLKALIYVTLVRSTMTIVRQLNQRSKRTFRMESSEKGYINRRECPSCGRVEFKHIRRNTQSAKCKCGTPMTAQDVAWKGLNPYVEYYVGNEFSMGSDYSIEYVWKLDDRYAEEIMALFPLDGFENMSHSRYDRQQPDVIA